MNKLLKAYKERRIVHINVNIIIAGILSTLLAIYPVYLLSNVIDNTKVFVITSFLVDGVIDFSLFSILHGFVNNKKLRKASKIRIFANDILIIQKQRIVLTGIFFIFATGGHFI